MPFLQAILDKQLERLEDVVDHFRESVVQAKIIVKHVAILFAW
jgi:hypothetical protein